MIKTNFAGTSAYDVLIDTGKANGVFDYELLGKIELFQKELEQDSLVGKSSSIVQMVKNASDLQLQ